MRAQIPAGALADAKPTAEGGGGGGRKVQNLFSHCWFLDLPPLPCWGMGSGGGGRRPHSLELSLYLQWANFESLEIRGQVFVLEASEVASGVGEGWVRAGPGWETPS